MSKVIIKEGDTLTASPVKALTAVETADLEGQLRVAVNDPEIKNVVMDLKRADYVSSAGLRVFLAMHKLLAERGGSFVLKNVNEDVMGIIKITGFHNVLKIE